MKDALGLIEIQGLATAILVADTMVKTANVFLLEVEKTRGLGWMTVKITGDVAAVTAALQSGRRVGESFGHFITCKVIPRPSDSVGQTFCRPPIQEEERGAPLPEPKGGPEKTPEPQTADAEEKQKKNSMTGTELVMPKMQEQISAGKSKAENPAEAGDGKESLPSVQGKLGVPLPEPEGGRESAAEAPKNVTPERKTEIPKDGPAKAPEPQMEDAPEKRKKNSTTGTELVMPKTRGQTSAGRSKAKNPAETGGGKESLKAGRQKKQAASSDKGSPGPAARTVGRRRISSEGKEQ